MTRATQPGYVLAQAAVGVPVAAEAFRTSDHPAPVDEVREQSIAQSGLPATRTA